MTDKSIEERLDQLISLWSMWPVPEGGNGYVGSETAESIIREAAAEIRRLREEVAHAWRSHVAATRELVAETARRESAEALLRRINDPDNYTTDAQVAEHFARFEPKKDP